MTSEKKSPFDLTSKRGGRYIRVSTDEQSTARQYDSTDSFALRYNFSYVRTFEDTGKRHHAEKREEFQVMLHAMESGQLDFIVVDDVDRIGFSRKYELFSYLDRFIQWGVELWDVDGKCWTADEQGAEFQVATKSIQSIGELFDKGKRFIGACRTIAKAGIWRAATPPYGLDIVWRETEALDAPIKCRAVHMGKQRYDAEFDDGRKGCYPKVSAIPVESDWVCRLHSTIEVDRLQTVRMIAEWYDTLLLGEWQIARKLNEIGIERMNGGKWAAPIIRRMLLNPVYIGKPAYGMYARGNYAEYAGGRIKRITTTEQPAREHPREDWAMPENPLFAPIIPVEQWNRNYQRLMTPRRQLTKGSHTHWLGPFVRCSECGSKMYIRKAPSDREKYTYFVCSSSKSSAYIATGSRKCDPKSVQAARIERLVEDWLERLGEHVDANCGESYRQQLIATMKASQEQRRKAIENEIERKQQEQQNLVIKSDAFDKTALRLVNQKVNGLETEIAELIRERHELEKGVADAEHNIDELVENVTAAQQSDDRARQGAFSKLVERIDFVFRSIPPEKQKRNRKSECVAVRITTTPIVHSAESDLHTRELGLVFEPYEFEGIKVYTSAASVRNGKSIRVYNFDDSHVLDKLIESGAWKEIEGKPVNTNKPDREKQKELCRERLGQGAK